MRFAIGALVDAWPAVQDNKDEWLRVAGVKLEETAGSRHIDHFRPVRIRPVEHLGVRRDRYRDIDDAFI